MSASRACGRIDVGRWASAGGWIFDVWFVLGAGIEVVRRGRVRVLVKRKIIVLKCRESIVDWQGQWWF